MTQLNFDARQIAPEFGRDTLPAGWYIAMIDESELKPTKDGVGAYLNLRFNILDAAFAGRKVFQRLNIHNQNQEAVTIAFRQLSAIAHAVNILQVADSSQLHNIPMAIKIKVRKDASGQYDEQNEISSIKSVAEYQQSAAAANAGAPSGVPSAPPIPTAPPIAPPAPPAPAVSAFPQFAPPSLPPVAPAPMPAAAMGAPMGWANAAPTLTPNAPVNPAPAAPAAAPAPISAAIPPWLANGQPQA